MLCVLNWEISIFHGDCDGFYVPITVLMDPFSAPLVIVLLLLGQRSETVHELHLVYKIFLILVVQCLIGVLYLAVLC